jgi:hypothetical protein
MSDEPTSPVCYAAQADDRYMGYATRDELLAALTELLEAERAGAKVALASTGAAGPDYANLMRSLRKDEARWCAMLSRQIGRFGGTPSRRTGAFRGKAMAVADPGERLAFLNRGQGWVVRKLEALLPRIRDDALHAELRAMLAGHKANIDVAAAFLKNDAQDTAK